MGGLYSHTTRSTGTTLTAAIYNADHQNHIDNLTPAMMDDMSANAAAFQTTTSPGGVGSESLPTSLAGEIERIRHVIKTMHGGAQWYPGTERGAAISGLTDNQVLRANGTTGVQGSVATIADTTGNLTIAGTGTHASVIQGSGALVTWTLDRTDTHGDNTLVGSLEFRGRDSGGATQAYGFMDVRAVLDDAGAETGGFEWRTGNAGSATNRLALRTGLYTTNATSGDMGADTINASAFYENGRRVFPAGCWGYVTYSGGTPTLVDSANVTSIGDGGTGDLDVTIATDHANATYAVHAMLGNSTFQNAFTMEDSDNRLAGSFTILVSTSGSSGFDPVSINFATFGDI